MKFLLALLRNERAASAIEYGLLAAVIGVVAVGAMLNVGNEVDQSYSDTETAMVEANSLN